jgi:glycosyltransferase involved in cell wall biosynthesis
MKVAIISSGFLPVVDGVTVTLMNRLHRLSEWGHQVLLFCPDYSSLEKIYPNWRDYTGNILPGVKEISLSSESLMGLDFERNVTRESYQTVLQELEKFQPDIIHVDEPERLFVGFWKIPGIKFAKQKHIPCVSFYHTNFLDYGQDYFATPIWLDLILKWIFQFPLAWIYHSYDATLVSGEITYKKLAKMGIKNIIQDKLLGVDIEKFNSEIKQKKFFEISYKLPEIDKKLKLIFLSRLTPDKGWHFTINAFSRLFQEISSDNLAIIIAGDGAMRDEVEKKLGKLTVNVYFLGRVNPDKVPELLINCDIHITASEKETRGLTVLEAFAAGRPVIAPRAGGIIDSIQDGWNGFLYHPQDSKDFVQKLKLLINNPALREFMGARGKEYIAEYSWDNAVKNLLKIWEEQIALYRI